MGRVMLCTGQPFLSVEEILRITAQCQGRAVALVELLKTATDWKK